MRIRRSKRVRVSLDITPLIDVVFLLLIFIMLSSSFVLQPGIRIELPEAQAAEAESLQPLVLRVPRAESAACYVGNVRVEMDELPAYLKRLRAESESETLVIACDKRASVERFVKVLDIAKAAGFENLDIATRK